MKQRTWYLFIAIVSIVVIPHICSSNANAQVDEAMGTNWDNAGKLYKMIVDAFEAGKQEDVYNLTGEFRDNLDYVQSKLDRVGQRLHDKDKNWPWSTKKDAAIQKTQQAKVAAGLLGSVAKSDGLVKAEPLPMA